MNLIHYGATTFDPSLFEEISNREMTRNKPKGGLWTSPVDSEYGWKEWCKDENFRDCSKDESFIISLKEDTHILEINNRIDLEEFEWIINAEWDWLNGIDFEELKSRYDAVHLTDTGQWATRGYGEKNLYGWDCESVLILNKECINE